MIRAPITAEVERKEPKVAERWPPFVFRWEGWRKFLRDLLIMQVGFALIGLYIGIVSSAGIDHLVPWGMLEYYVADSLGIDVGSAFVIVSVVAILLVLILREPFGWGSIAGFVLLTVLWADLGEQVVPDLSGGGDALHLVYVLLAVLIGALGTAIYVSVNAGAAPRDSIMLAIARIMKVNVGVARFLMEAALVGIGLVLGRSIGVVTIAHIAIAGPAIWLAFRLLRIERQHPFWGRTSDWHETATSSRAPESEGNNPSTAMRSQRSV